MCKHGDMLSLAVLIGRGLDLMCISSGLAYANIPHPLSSLFSFEGAGTFVPHFQPTGADDGEVPPVPIPNTEVKLTCADNTWGAAPWKDK